jgi:hypothetical protein
MPLFRYALTSLSILSLPVLWAAPLQKKVSELTLVYDYSVIHLDSSTAKTPTQNAVHTIYVKGKKCRSEITTNSPFSSTTIFDGTTGSGVILREVSGQKLLIRLNPQNWADRNRLSEGIVYKNTGETKEIAGYKCIKAVGTTRTGASITVYYTGELIPETREYDPYFKSLDGLPLEYELTSGNLKIRYRISRMSFNPVPESKFDIPSSGYREMNYEESKKMSGGR